MMYVIDIDICTSVRKKKHACSVWISGMSKVWKLILDFIVFLFDVEIAIVFIFIISSFSRAGVTSSYSTTRTYNFSVSLCPSHWLHYRCLIFHLEVNALCKVHRLKVSLKNSAVKKVLALFDPRITPVNKYLLMSRSNNHAKGMTHLLLSFLVLTMIMFHRKATSCPSEKCSCHRKMKRSWLYTSNFFILPKVLNTNHGKKQ